MTSEPKVWRSSALTHEPKTDFWQDTDRNDWNSACDQIVQKYWKVPHNQRIILCVSLTPVRGAVEASFTRVKIAEELDSCFSWDHLEDRSCWWWIEFANKEDK